MERYGKYWFLVIGDMNYISIVKTVFISVISDYMFSKIKDIKRKIYFAKIGGIIFSVIFLFMLGMIVFQQFQIHSLSERVEKFEFE